MRRQWLNALPQNIDKYELTARLNLHQNAKKAIEAECFHDFFIGTSPLISQLLIGPLIIAVTTILHAALVEAGITGLTLIGKRPAETPSYLTKIAMCGPS